MRSSALFGLFITLLLAPLAADAQVSVGESGTLSGRAYMDYYWVAANHNESLEGRNGFWFRRIYLTYDRDMAGNFSSRLRLEMDNPGNFISNAKLEPVVKDAWLRWSSKGHQLTAGISSPPTLALVEDVWGYRAVEKTAVDLHGMGASRDFGLSAKGTLGEEGRFSYHAMVGNGVSNRTEVDRGKKAMLSLSYELTPELVVEVYGDYNDFAGDRYWTTLQAFAGYQGESFQAGAHFTRQYRRGATSGENLEIKLVSVFARGDFSDRVTGLVRVDRLFNPNPAGENTSYLPYSNMASPTVLIGGLDVRLEEDIHLIPNFEAVFYSENDQEVQPDSDFIPRLTLYYRF
ncbi:MAG: hypothetical protein U5K31_03760 [Balneolaceae bacterium]|nr:hypothetical protein [Balneolaceae bacterium]